jgi:hypothetical protein
MLALDGTWRGIIEFGASSLFVVLRLAKFVRVLRIALSIAVMYGGSIAARYLDLAIMNTMTSGFMITSFVDPPLACHSRRYFPVLAENPGG